MDQVQGRVVHLVVLVHLEHPLHHPGHIVHNIPVLAVEGGLALGDQEQVEIAFLVMGQPVRQPLVQAVDDPLILQGLVEQLPGQLPPLARGREHHHPGKQLVGGQEDPGMGVHPRRLFLRILPVLPLGRLLLPGLFGVLVLVLDGLQPEGGRRPHSPLEPGLLLLHHLRG